MSFKDILAQPVAVNTLRRTLAAGKISGPYLFWGPEGVGKRFAAKELAKAINCEAAEHDACGLCVSCQKMERRSHPDLFWVEPKSQTAQLSIEAIRELKKEIALKPWEGKKRVVVLVEAERATEEAQNAFLKMLEETPLGSLIILTSVKSEGILPTVLSRCKMVRFGPVPTETILNFLKKETGLSAEKAGALAKLCHGSLGRARLMNEDFLEGKFEILSQFLERALHIDEEKEFFEDKESVFSALELLTTWYRDLWIAKEGSSRELLFHEDRLPEIKEESSRWTEEALHEALSELLLAREMLDQHVNTRLLLYTLSRRMKALQGASR